MSCYTYFPKSKVGSKEGEQTDYLRPCQSSCFNYIRSCQVECCDESVQCSFTHTKQLSATEAVETKGYVEHDGPSSLCTGAAARSGPGALLWLLLGAPLAWASAGRALALAALVALAVSLQGC